MARKLLGKQLVLDFENIPPLYSPTNFASELFHLLKFEKDLIITEQISDHSEGSSFVLIIKYHFLISLKIIAFSMIYIFLDFTFICHWFKTSKTLSFDVSYHNVIECCDDRLKFFEEKLCEAFGWYNSVTSLILSRYSEGQFTMNDADTINVVQKNAKLLERVKSDYQDIRVFETEHMGRIMNLDGCVQISDELDDNYTLDMIKFVIEPEKEYQNVLILGGGDLVIPSHLIKNYKNVKKLTVCEIDEKVTSVVRKYFLFSEIFEREEVKKMFTLQIEDGGNFVKNAKNNNELYDGIIIDCTDVDLEDAVALSLFNVPFYQNLRDIMKEGAYFSQQVTDNNSKKKFQKMVLEAGFVDPKFIFCETPEYSVLLPIGVVQK